MEAALASGAAKHYRTVWFTVKDRTTGTPYSEGYWMGDEALTIPVWLPDGGQASRLYYRGKNLIDLPAIPRVADLTIPRIPIRLSHVSDRVNNLIRFYEPRLGEVQIHRAIAAASSPYQVLDRGHLEFIGWIDEIDITTPAEGGFGEVVVQCVGDSMQLTRAYTGTRSSEDQQANRLATDTFFDDVETWEQDHFWGQKPGKVKTRNRGGTRQRGTSSEPETYEGAG